MIGQTLDHYRIESKLGEGGMGVVYKGRDTHLDRTVAIKVLPADSVADPSRKQRFAQEAKAASALNHPNIVTIYDIRSQDGTDFIVMEYIEGQTLDKCIGPTGMRPMHVLKYAAQIADALIKAHGAGILHRDLKPSNIMVTEEGSIKILDFGLAKLLEPPDFSADGTTLTARSITEQGTVLGTTAYMSPEQAEGRKLDGRSDIFSFGSVLYEMVTGRRAFTGDSRLAVLSKILNQDPEPPGQLAASVPQELEGVILRCLRKDPAGRYQTMADLKVALEDLHEESPARKPELARPRRWLWAAVIPALLIAGGLVWWARRVPSPPAETLRAVALTTFPGLERYPSLSPDGNYVAFMWTGPKQDNADIYVQQIGAGSPLRLTSDPLSDQNPVWSPDGRWVAFLRGSPSASKVLEAGRAELRLIPPLGGRERKLTDIDVRWFTPVAPALISWCPNSDCLIVTDSQGEGKPVALFVVALDTGEKRQLTFPQLPIVGDANPVVSRDGRSLVFQRNPTAVGAELYWLRLGKGLTAEGEPKRLTPASLNATYPAWMPDGKEVLFSSGTGLWRLAITQEKQGEVVPSRLPFVGEDGLMPVVSTPQPGRPLRLVYVRSFADPNIWRVDTSDLSSPHLSTFISSTRTDNNAQFSPNGRSLVFQSDRSGEPEVWLADADGSNAVQLTSMHGSETATPRWSPDGEMIVFNSNVEGQQEIYVIPAGGGKPRRLTSHRATDIIPSFSHDGKWIYFTSSRSGKFQIWKVPTSGGDAVQLTTNVGYVAWESPDGAYVYYTERNVEASPLWRLPTAGGQPVKVLDGVIMRAFVVLEKGIYYIDRLAGETRLRSFDFATQKSAIVARDLGDARLGLTVSPDGRTILYTRRDSSIDDLMLVENFR